MTNKPASRSTPLTLPQVRVASPATGMPRLARSTSSRSSPRGAGQRPVPDRAQPVHDLVLAPAEIVVQPHVLRVQLVVHLGAGAVGPVDAGLDPAHGRGPGRHVPG